MKKLISFLALAMLTSGCATITLNENKQYYTKTNIWYEKAEYILPIFHKGDILPVGTKVNVSNASGNRVTFRPETRSIDFTLVNGAKYSNIGIEEFFNRYFSESNIKAEGGTFYNFTYEEKKNIDNGEIALGMSKEAVLMAYGYPPGHTTPDIQSDRWTYWINKFKKFNVEFKDNRTIIVNKKEGMKLINKSLTPEDIKVITTRRIEGQYKDIYKACLTVFQNKGLIVKSTDTNTGLITAGIENTSEKHFRFAQAFWLGAIYDEGTKIELSCMVNRINDNLSEVRINMQDTQYNISERRELYDSLFNEIALEAIKKK